LYNSFFPFLCFSYSPFRHVSPSHFSLISLLLC
jgi:hypothetical protein